MEQYEGPDQQRNAWAALAAGGITGGIGVGAGRLAQHFGLETAETLMAGKLARGESGDVLVGGVKGAQPPEGWWEQTRGRRIAGGALNEAVLQELPQSMQEQAWQNIGEGKPWQEGVVRGGVEGALAGGLMGGAFNAGGHVSARAQYDQRMQDTRQGYIDQVNEAQAPVTALSQQNDALIQQQMAEQQQVEAAQKTREELTTKKLSFPLFFVFQPIGIMPPIAAHAEY
jgi:hypothetical protein